MVLDPRLAHAHRLRRSGSDMKVDGVPSWEMSSAKSRIWCRVVGANEVGMGSFEAGFETLESPARIAMSVRGDTAAQVYVMIGSAMITQLVDEVTIVPTGIREVALRGSSQEELFKNWISHILMLAFDHGFLMAHGRIGVSEGRLAGRLFGEERAQIKLSAVREKLEICEVAWLEARKGVAGKVIIDF